MGSVSPLVPSTHRPSELSYTLPSPPIVTPPRVTAKGDQFAIRFNLKKTGDKEAANTMASLVSAVLSANVGGDGSSQGGGALIYQRQLLDVPKVVMRSTQGNCLTKKIRLPLQPRGTKAA